MIIYDKKEPTTKKKKQTKKTMKDFHPVQYLQLGLAVLTIFGIIYFYIYQNNIKNYKNIKIEKNSPLVLTRFSNDNSNYPIDVPYINIKSDTVEKINSEILANCQTLANKKNSVIIYEYETNGEILSLVLKTIDNTKLVPVVEFKTYNINLKTISLLNDDEILALYNLRKTDVEKTIESKFRNYYNEEVKEGYLTSKECNYDCFLKYREVSNYLDNVEYYISNKNLVAYRAFATKSIFSEEEFYKEETFAFQITGSEQES